MFVVLVFYIISKEVNFIVDRLRVKNYFSICISSKDEIFK